MISKTMIGVILASALVSSAMVYHGVASRHPQQIVASVPAQPIPAIPKPAAGTPLNGEAADPADTNDPNGPDAQPVDPSQDQAVSDGQEDSADSDRQEEVTPVQTPPVYRVVRVRPVVRVKVVHPADAELAAVTACITHPATATPVASIAAAAMALRIPAGTPLFLRLSEPLGSDTSQIDQSFSAKLERDIYVDGKAVIPAGAPIVGKVVFARRAGALAGEANLQLELTSINVKDHELDLSTAVQSFGPSIQGKNKFSRFIKGIGKRAGGDEHEVLLSEQSMYSFTLSRPLQIQ